MTKGVSNFSDVLIIGAGIAGLVMAYECLNKGLRVVIIERDSEENIGGLAKRSFGGMALVDTPLQRRIGVKDSKEIARRDWYSFAKFEANDHWPKQWANYYIENSRTKVYDYLVGHGLKYFPAVNWVERGLQGDGNSLPRYHVLWGTGYTLVERFVQLLDKHPNKSKLNILFHHKAFDFIKQANKVVACKVVNEANNESLVFTAESIVAACGGINGSLDKVRECWHKPWGKAPVEMLNGSHPFADGLIHDAAISHGANVTHLDHMWNYAAGIPHPEPKFDQHGLSLIPCKSALWLDHKARRIGPDPLVTGFDTNELCRRVSELDKPYTWQVFNWRIAARELAISGSEHNPSIRDKKLIPFLKEVVLGNHQLIKKLEKDSDHFLVANNLNDLVIRMNRLNENEDVDVVTLKREIEEYDRMILRGRSLWNDEQLRRIQQARAWRSEKFRTCKPKPIMGRRSGPLIAVKLRLISRKSLGGIQTNLDSQVLNTQGEPIDGLFAIGEASGFGGGGSNGFKSLEGTFLAGCIMTAQNAANAVRA